MKHHLHLDSRVYTLYALQVTCGGRFPSHATQPDVVRSYLQSAGRVTAVTVAPQVLHAITTVTSTLLAADPTRVSVGVVQVRRALRPFNLQHRQSFRCPLRLSR